MKLVSYLNDGHDQFALLVDGLVYNADLVHMELPSSMGMFLNYWEDLYPVAVSVNEAIIDGRISKAKGVPLEKVE
jgi:fumarylacetoacetate (FAA) hydrolase